MGVEIERKFLVTSDTWRTEDKGVAYCQGYLCCSPEITVRVRTEGEKACLTMKGKMHGISRSEFEYAIPFSDAQELQKLSITPLVTKIRYKIPYEEHLWEIDEFQGENKGLFIAEVELEHPEAVISLPPWVGAEVSHDPRYCNSNLAIHPFTKWPKKEG